MSNFPIYDNICLQEHHPLLYHLVKLKLSIKLENNLHLFMSQAVNIFYEDKVKQQAYLYSEF